MRAASALFCAAMAIASPALAQAASADASEEALGNAAMQAERELRQTFTNLQFEEFGPAPVRGAIYQAIAGGRVSISLPRAVICCSRRFTTRMA